MSTSEKIQETRLRGAEAAAVDMLEGIFGSSRMMKEGMGDTPRRLVRALASLNDGYSMDPVEILSKVFPSEGASLVAVPAIRFASLCEHHILPFTGTVSVAYAPGDVVVGLSKIPRAVRALSRRLQVQERLTKQIADALVTALAPRGVLVVVRSEHSCKTIRGVESPGPMVTVERTGVFADPETFRSTLQVMEGAK